VANQHGYRNSGVEKKGPTLTSVTSPLVKALHASDVAVSINRVDAAELEEM
jgi:hypothetical protein